MDLSQEAYLQTSIIIIIIDVRTPEEYEAGHWSMHTY